MSALYEHHYLVTRNDIDGMGHANNVSYVRWMQDAAVAHSKDRGWHSARYQEIDAAWVARTHFIEYLQPSYEGDEIVVLTWISDLKKITSRRKYKMIRPADDTVLAIAETNWAFISLSQQMPKRIPKEIRESFIMISNDEEP
ncbi:acyl-CoA thioesterase [Planctomycetaceae bacterium]|jgi:acyl-CoA thioester hydrolase|nr:acyl-CoA thioesterase [bacterium]MDB4679618.1 acyl-CoA thioesterase [Planctomycetaceae bacterium]MDC0274092.1 acyl-CoA thioesterase [Planctomycetaceae bacterium]